MQQQYILGRGGRAVFFFLFFVLAKLLDRRVLVGTHTYSRTHTQIWAKRNGMGGSEWVTSSVVGPMAGRQNVQYVEMG